VTGNSAAWQCPVKSVSSGLIRGSLQCEPLSCIGLHHISIISLQFVLSKMCKISVFLFCTISVFCLGQMMEGFMDASSGSIVVEGHSVRSGMEGMSGLVGICPQHDLLWESLTGREHLLFYARLHALKVHHMQLGTLTSCELYITAASSCKPR